MRTDFKSEKDSKDGFYKKNKKKVPKVLKNVKTVYHALVAERFSDWEKTITKASPITELVRTGNTGEVREQIIKKEPTEEKQRKSFYGPVCDLDVSFLRIWTYCNLPPNFFVKDVINTIYVAKVRQKYLHKDLKNTIVLTADKTI